MRHVWGSAGYRTIGCSLAARAANGLEEATGIKSTSIARFIRNLETNTTRLDHRTKIVIDEAAMVGTRTLATIFAHANNAGAQIVLLGDPKQLTEIEAGGLFAKIAKETDPIGLTTNRRQREPWERDALAELRDGNIHIGDGTNVQLIADWWNAREPGATVLILASRRTTAQHFNLTAHACMRNNKQLHGPELPTPNGTIQVGEQVILTKTDDKLGLTNGTIATVRTINHETREIDAIDQNDRAFQIPSAYLDAGHVHYGYATTIHKTQGTTIDQAFVWVTPELQRESAYSALSRGRQSNHLYLAHDHGLDLPAAHTAALDEPEQHLPSPKPAPPIAALTQQLEAHNPKHLALDVEPEQEPERPSRGFDLGM
jgi:ATP-dependent exoDNAse (exonuclease V) alpha subunit